MKTTAGTISRAPSSRASRAARSVAEVSFIGSEIWILLMPYRTTSLNASRMTDSGERSQLMKRIPVVMNPSGVVGIAARASRIRSNGSSRW